MATWIALLRGVNVGGKGIVPMKRLAALLGEQGLGNVRTYIQSGNVAFESSEMDPAVLVARIRGAIDAEFGFAPSVQVLSEDVLQAAASANPFPEAEGEPKFLHLSFLVRQPDEAAVATLAEWARPDERYSLQGRVFYLHAPSGIARSKLAGRVERTLGEATSRNWRTVQKLLLLAGS